MEAINWIDNSGDNDEQSVEYATPYLLNDFFLAFMFFRFYFFARALLMTSPVNERLYGKRVCQNAGFEAKFSFQLKSVMRDYAFSTFVMMSLILILSLTFVTRIFERPYFSFNFSTDTGEPLVFYNF